ncbi:MAG: TRAP transporter substrate-binding protein DctP [Rhodocyclaceae bacterium]|nr:TRAP transporter substrate-binding protein DctP [Rhodocyclaceae bacterium]
MRHLIALLLGCLLLATAGAADPKLRIGTLAPKNSLYYQQLIELGEAWRSAQGGNARYMVYPDGGQGGEAEMVRRMRIGQLQGALLSVVGLREIERSIAALQSMPLMFRSWEEVDYVREQIRPAMEQKFLEKDFVVLAWGDAGWVRFFSKDPAFAPGDYIGMKFFAWGGEFEQQEIMKSLGYTPVPLETADVLPAIQTGMINAVPSTPYFALASQIYRNAPNMLDLNWAPIVGALVVTRSAWEQMSPEGQAALRASGLAVGERIRAQARKEVDGAVEAMVKRGLVVNEPDPDQRKAWQALAAELYPRIRGTLVPAETFDEVLAHLEAYRAGHKAN